MKIGNVCAIFLLPINLTNKITSKMHAFQTGLSRNWARNNTVFKLLVYHRKEKECRHSIFFFLFRSYFKAVELNYAPAPSLLKVQWL